MRKLSAIAAAGFVLAAATSASATTYTINLTGTITATGGAPGVISVGDPITLSTTFDDSYVVAWGNTGYMVAAGQKSVNSTNTSLPLSGPLNWSLTLDGMVSDVRDYENDFTLPWYREGPVNSPTFALSGVGIVFNSGGVYGVDDLDMFDPSWVPPLFYSDSAELPGLIPAPGFPPAATPGNFPALTFGAGFSGVYEGNPLFVHQETFQGVWNLAGASILVNGVAVPEPSTWAMMIAGLGLVGAGMRMRRRKSLAAT